MEIIKKEGVSGFRIVAHNKKVFYAIVVILFLLLGIFIYLKISPKECYSDRDCVEDSCCHASSCVSLLKSPVCKDIRCSQECKPNTLDCGQAKCVCLKNKCSAIKNE